MKRPAVVVHEDQYLKDTQAVCRICGWKGPIHGNGHLSLSLLDAAEHEEQSPVCVEKAKR